MSIVETFLKAVSFFDTLKEDGFIEDYALIGGLALSAWVRPRTTRDVDFVVILSEGMDWPDIVAAIETRLQKRVVIRKRKQANIQEMLSFMEGQIQVDVISARGLSVAQEAIKNAATATLFGHAIKVATPEYLILLKLLPLSEQDILDIKALTQKADKENLSALADKFFLRSRLDRVLKRKKSTP